MIPYCILRCSYEQIVCIGGIQMVRLRPFKKQDIEKILPWLTDERIMAMWSSGVFAYPLTEEQLLARMEEAEKSDREWIMAALNEEGQLIGHLYMRNADYENNSLHLGMIVVDHTRRGQGLGVQMLQKAVEYAFLVLGMQRVTLGVFDCNPGAHACYRKAGFRDDYIEENAYVYHGEVWNRQHMVIEREA